MSTKVLKLFHQGLKTFHVSVLLCIFTVAPRVQLIKDPYLFRFISPLSRSHTLFSSTARLVAICPKSSGCFMPLCLCSCYFSLESPSPPFLFCPILLILQDSGVSPQEAFMNPHVKLGVPNPLPFVVANAFLQFCINHVTLKLFPHVSISPPRLKTPLEGPNSKC